MNFKTLTLAAIAVALFTVACSSNPAAPAPTCTDRGASNFGGPLPCTYPPPIPACQLHHTGVLILQNKAANLRPRNVWVDSSARCLDILTGDNQC